MFPSKFLVELFESPFENIKQLCRWHDRKSRLRAAAVAIAAASSSTSLRSRRYSLHHALANDFHQAVLIEKAFLAVDTTLAVHTAVARSDG